MGLASIRQYGAVGDTNLEQSIVSYLRIKHSILILAAVATCTGLSPASYSSDDRSLDALRDARNELLRKQDDLRKEEDSLKREIDSLKDELRDRNEPALDDQLKDKKYRLDQVEAEIDKTQDALRDVERNIR
ncbi:MAG: hypothetical protein C5B53_02295 [Candidatus Melainabacteria bacterium]|nr:MAG: hypothetical protein C5B53_02295 [Candidatus Melainabacteria bacterium]